MNWNEGYSAQFYMTEVDPATWRDRRTIDITEAKVSRTAEALRASADIDTVDYGTDLETWVRIWLDARQAGDGEHVALFTGLATSPSVEITGALTNNKLEAYSVLKPCEDVLLQRGWYAAAEISCESVLRNLLANTPAPIEMAEDVPPLKKAIIAEDNETALTMVDKILEAIDWRLQLDGDGTIIIQPQSGDIAAIFDPFENDSIEPSVTVDHDWFECPNVLRAVSDDLVAIARDESEGSPYSVQNRGREVWAQEDNVDLSEEESIEEYALRRLKELQTTARKVKYTRRYTPSVNVGDNVRLNYAEHELIGTYRVTSQNLDVSHGVQVSEEATTE